jgi:hypothetical protein
MSRALKSTLSNPQGAFAFQLKTKPTCRSAFPRASSPRESSQAPSLQEGVRAWRLEAGSVAPLVDAAVAAGQPDALRACFPVQADSPDGSVEPPACSADSPPACSVALPDAQELPLAGCFPDGCSAAPRADGSARAGYSAEPPEDALALQSADSLQSDDYSAVSQVHGCSAAPPQGGSIPQAGGSVPPQAGLAACSVARAGLLPLREDDWPEPLRHRDDSAPADCPGRAAPACAGGCPVVAVAGLPGGATFTAGRAIAAGGCIAATSRLANGCPG